MIKNCQLFVSTQYPVPMQCKFEKEYAIPAKFITLFRLDNLFIIFTASCRYVETIIEQLKKNRNQ